MFVEITGPALEEWGLPDGQACMVVTVRDGRIVRMQDHRSGADALPGAGLAPRQRPPTPLEHTEPGWDEVIDLVPVHPRRRVEASIAFYAARLPGRRHLPAGPAAHRLGRARERPRAADARPPRRADRPAPTGGAVLPLARDLFRLREPLVAAGVDSGEIRDGSPAPKVEMRVEDPDGYVLMIAQIEVHEDEDDDSQPSTGA